MSLKRKRGRENVRGTIEMEKKERRAGRESN